MIVVFFVDTSVSMNQKVPNQGMTLLDVAKCGVEHFIKVRRDKADGRNDKYWLVTTDAGALALKIGPKEPQGSLKDVLKCLAGHSYTTLESSLKVIFEVLNQTRLLHQEPSGMDHYSFGWHPYSTEPAVILLFTDGTLPNSERGVADSLVIPSLNRAESELTEQPFHWDQRLFSFEIRPPCQMDTASQVELLTPRVGLKEQCQATGGNAHVALNLKHLHGLLEQLASKLTKGVVVNLTVEIPMSLEDGAVADKLYQRPVLISPLKPDGPGHWPIPEDFHMDSTVDKPPARRPRPYITLRRSRDFDGVVPPYLWHDVYTLEPSPFTEVLVKKFRNEVWKAYVRRRENTTAEEETFGFLKVDPVTNAVQLSVLPYNYPELLNLLSKCIEGKGSGISKTQRWRRDFDTYIKSVPMYYLGPLRQALRDKRLLLHDFIPSDAESEPSRALKEYFKTLKSQAKVEFDVWQAQRQALLQNMPIPGLQGASNASPTAKMRGPPVAEVQGDKDANFLYSSPFDIPRSSLLIQLERLQALANSMAHVPAIAGADRAKAAEGGVGVSRQSTESVSSPSFRWNPLNLAVAAGSQSTVSGLSSATSTESLERELDDSARKRNRFQRLLRRQQVDFDWVKEDSTKHLKSVNAMGNYIGYLERKLASPALRDLRDPFAEDDQETLVVNFGSRYKDKKKKKRPPESIVTKFSIDEADVSEEILRSVKRVPSDKAERPAKKLKPSSPGEVSTNGLPSGAVDAANSAVQSPPPSLPETAQVSSGQPMGQPRADQLPGRSSRSRSPSPSFSEERPRTSMAQMHSMGDRVPLANHPALRDSPAQHVEAMQEHVEWLHFLKVSQGIRLHVRRQLCGDPRAFDARKFMELVRSVQGNRVFCLQYLSRVKHDLQQLQPLHSAKLAPELNAYLQHLSTPS